MEKKIKISIVDDHPTFRTGIRSVISDCYNLVFLSEAGNGKEFIESLKNGIPDILLLDFEMPEMDGAETTEYLSKHFPQVKVIIMTMHDDEELALFLAKKGIRGYLPKDSSLEKITEAIDSVMGNQGYYFNDYISRESLRKLLDGEIINPKFNPALLSIREQQVVSLLCLENSGKEVAEILSVSARTIETHRENIMQKIGAAGFAGLILYGLKNRLDTKFGYSRKKLR